MPATVSNAEGSLAEGTSEAEGMRLWPRSSKKLRKRSRISSEVMGALILGAAAG